jgi:hypothetical protein
VSVAVLIAGAPATASIAGTGPAVSQAEGEAAERRVSVNGAADLLEQVVEGGVTGRPIALLKVDLDLDRMLIVSIAKAAERLLGFARIAVAQDDKAPPGIFSGSTLLRSIVAPSTVSSSALSAFRTCSALLAGIDYSARSCCSISAGSCPDQRSAARATSSRLDSFTCGTSRNITTVVRPCAAPGPICCAPEASQLTGLPAE